MGLSLIFRYPCTFFSGSWRVARGLENDAERSEAKCFEPRCVLSIAVTSGTEPTCRKRPSTPDDSRDAEVLADALRTDPRCFRPLAPIDPTVVELREWSRIADDLRAERNRLGNRVRELLWRYYPQFLELTDDIAAGWFLDLWRLIPTPDKAMRVREATVDRLLKRHRIRRLTAAGVLERLKAPAVPTAAGTMNAATAHLEAVAQRLDLVNLSAAD